MDRHLERGPDISPLSQKNFNAVPILPEERGIREQALNKPTKLSRAAAVGSRRVDQSSQRSKHRGRMRLRAVIFLDRLNYRSEGFQRANIPAARQPPEHHIHILFVSQSQLF